MDEKFERQIFSQFKALFSPWIYLFWMTEGSKKEGYLKCQQPDNQEKE